MSRRFLFRYGPYAYQWKKQFANMKLWGWCSFKTQHVHILFLLFWLIYKRISRWHEAQDNFLEEQSCFFMKGGDRYLFFEGLCDPTTPTKCTIHWQHVGCGWMYYQGLVADSVQPPTCTSLYLGNYLCKWVVNFRGYYGK